MKTVTILKGLPASGKSSWAFEYIEKHPGTTKRVNKDDLRAMLDGSEWSKDNEEFILNLRDHIILESLKDGKNVIVDDTNLDPKHEKHIRELVKCLAQVVIKDAFLEVPVLECMRRDSKRGEKSVGHIVIESLANRYLNRGTVPEQDAPLRDEKFVIKRYASENDDIQYAFEENGLRERLKDIDVIVAEVCGANDECPWYWILLMKDGSFSWATAECDYTGWDCQSSAEIHDGFRTWEEAVDDLEVYEFDDRKSNIKRCLTEQLKGTIPFAVYQKC